MKRGIIDIGVYLPHNRLKNEVINSFYNKGFAKGERAVAGYDEDSISMAVEAIRTLNSNLGNIDQLYFATTTPSYNEKSSISIISKALGMKEEILGIELGQSLRGGTSALLNAVSSAKQSLVVASDCRIGAPTSVLEKILGDGAVALKVGESDKVLAEFIDGLSIQDESITQWRSHNSTVLTAEDRFVEMVFQNLLSEYLEGFLNSNQLLISSFEYVVINGLNSKVSTKIAKKHGFTNKQIFQKHTSFVGDIGIGQSLFLLSAAIEEAEQNAFILVVNLAEGIDFLIFKKGESQLINTSIEKMVLTRNNNLTYSEYLRWKGLIEVEKPRRPDIDRPSIPALYRNYEQNLPLVGSSCNVCGTIQYPKQRICIQCNAKDEMENYNFANSKGIISTFTLDYLAASVSSPILAAFVDFENGSRMLVGITDYGLDEIKIGCPVEMTFRRLYEAGGIHNYYWKARPIRSEGGGTGEK